MTSTRDPQEPTEVTADQPATDDTAGFTLVNTTRSNIKTAPALSLGAPLVPSFAPPAPLGADVTGFVATDPATRERDQPAEDTAGFNLVNTTRSNIKASGSVVSPLSLGGGFTPSVGLPTLGEHDVAGFVAPDPAANEQPNDAAPDPDDTAGFGFGLNLLPLPAVESNQSAAAAVDVLKTRHDTVKNSIGNIR
jgi:hypothetical protein